jgi:hypothetical protein
MEIAKQAAAMPHIAGIDPARPDADNAVDGTHTRLGR